MNSFFQWLNSWWFTTMTPASVPLTTIFQRETMRKRRLLSLVILSSLLLILLSTIAASVAAYTPPISLGWIEACVLLLTLWLNRRGYLQVASLLLFFIEGASSLLTVHAFSFSNPISVLWTLSPMALLLTMAGLFLPAWIIVFMAGVEALVIWWYLLVERSTLLISLLAPQGRWNFLIYLLLVIGISAMIGAFYATTTKKALIAADRAAELELAHQAVTQAYSDLEEAHIIIQRQASLDGLTGLPNHGTIVERIEAELLLCQRSQRNCVIIFVDVDHFKRINDTWGHAVGDAVLQEVGQRLRTNLRKDDCVGRYGGEEFAILLSDTEQSQASEMAERLRCSIAEIPYLWQGEKAPSPIPIPLTASFGLAAYPLDGLTCKELVETADTAMYAAKYRGRNRVCLPDEEETEQNPLFAEYSEQSILQTLSTMAALHDQQTQAHADRMIELAEATMRALGRPEGEIILLRLAAQLHDIGKVGIPEAILHKPGPLTEEEWSLMHRHPQIGQQILMQAKGQFGLVSHIIVAHHERWDGQGYPYGLAQQEIPLGARILSVIDAYDAMTSARPYRQALSRTQAREELEKEAGRQFDPQVVETFLRVLQVREAQRSIAPAFGTTA